MSTTKPETETPETKTRQEFEAWAEGRLNLEKQGDQYTHAETARYYTVWCASRATYKDILNRCLREHPGITAYDGIHGGTPHLKGRRFTVGTVLARIYTGGSIKDVSDAYNIPEEELREALAFAQDFLEEVFHEIVEE